MKLTQSIGIVAGFVLAGAAFSQTYSVEVVPGWTGGTVEMYGTNINDNNWICGYGRPTHPAPSRGFIFRPSDTQVQASPSFAGWDQTIFTDLNNNGVVVGFASSGSLSEQSFTWSLGQANLSTLPTPVGETDVIARSINEAGAIAGNFGGGSWWDPTRGFVYRSSIGYTSLPTGQPTSNNTIATNIFTDGRVGGVSGGRSFLWTIGDAVLTLFGPGGDTWSVNSAGTAVGRAFNGSIYTAFVVKPGDAANTPLTNNGSASEALFVNEAGTITGWYTNGGVKPCYWKSNTTTPIELPLPVSATVGRANAVNANGWIVGSALVSGVWRAVLWKPVGQTFTVTTRDGDGSSVLPNTPFRIFDENGNIVATRTTNSAGTAEVTLLNGSYTLAASAHNVFFVNSPLCNSSSITVTGSGVSGDRNLELGTLEAYFTVGGRAYRGAGTITIGGVSRDLNRSRAGNWLTDGVNAKSFTATVTINGQTRLIPGTLIAGRDHTTLSFDWNNGS